MRDRVNVVILLIGIALMAAFVAGTQAGERVASERIENAVTAKLGLGSP